MNNNIYGYVRVSTKEQNVDRQLESLKEFGIENPNTYLKKVMKT